MTHRWALMVTLMTATIVLPAPLAAGDEDERRSVTAPDPAPAKAGQAAS